jgi:hypothetical protein
MECRRLCGVLLGGSLRSRRSKGATASAHERIIKTHRCTFHRSANTANGRLLTGAKTYPIDGQRFCIVEMRHRACPRRAFAHALLLAGTLTSAADRHLILYIGQTQKSQKVGNLFSRPKKAGGNAMSRPIADAFPLGCSTSGFRHAA